MGGPVLAMKESSVFGLSRGAQKGYSVFSKVIGQIDIGVVLQHQSHNVSSIHCDGPAAGQLNSFPRIVCESMHRRKITRTLEYPAGEILDKWRKWTMESFMKRYSTFYILVPLDVLWNLIPIKP
jgi:hypothetical protein